MKQFFTVFKFELMHYLKNKAYISTTIIISLIAIVLLSIPLLDFNNNKDKFDETSMTENVYGIFENEYIDIDDPLLEQYFKNTDFIEYKSEAELKDDVINEILDGGFIIESSLEYKYLVKNSSMSDSSIYKFNQIITEKYQSSEFEKLDIDPSLILNIIETNTSPQTIVLGKDSVNNYFYTYILLMMLYFMIIFYGLMVATGVASEKSNRAIEVLVTSAKPNNLIFGKVFAGATAGIIQFGIMIAAAKLTYTVNAQAWSYSLDSIFNIPLDALLSFAVFGLLGYLFYSFIYGALGALASKTEDINSSTMPIQIIYVITFLIVAAGMSNPNSTMMVIASYIPFSSFMAMFVRVAMTDVSNIEILISLTILIVSTGLVGLFGAKIYRLGTLRYGNPIKLKDAFKMLRNKQ